jgi:hypothetical protein
MQRNPIIEPIKIEAPNIPELDDLFTNLLGK